MFPRFKPRTPATPPVQPEVAPQPEPPVVQAPIRRTFSDVRPPDRSTQPMPHLQSTQTTTQPVIRPQTSQPAIDTPPVVAPPAESASTAAVDITPRPRGLLPAHVRRVTSAWPDKRLKVVLIGLGVVVLVVIGITLATLTHRKSLSPSAVATVRTIHDAHYSLTLPNGWQPDSSYHNGAGLSAFYPAGLAGNSSLVIYVLPQDSSNTSSDNHVATQLAGLKQNGATYSVVSNQTVNYGADAGTLQVAISSAASNPGRQQCHFYAAVDKGKVTYNLDAATALSDCSGTALQNFTKALKTFRPLSSDIVNQQH